MRDTTRKIIEAVLCGLAIVMLWGMAAILTVQWLSAV